MALKIEKGGWLVIGLIGVGLVGYSLKKYGILDKIAPSAKVQESTVPKRVDLPALNPSLASNVAAAPLPGSSPGCTDKPEVRMLVWAWNAQMGLMFANGGPQSTTGSLMCKEGVNLHLIRQDDSGKMQEALVAFATELKEGAANPSKGAHFVAIMGDGSAAFLKGLNDTLRRLGAPYIARVVAARRPVHPGAVAMSVWSWVKLTVCLWLIRKAFKAAGWLLLAAVAAAAWPVTLVALTGYAAAWLRGWPPARLGRAAAATLPVTAVWLIALAIRAHGGRAAALAPARDWEQGWSHLTMLGLTRTFLLLAPAAIPAGLGLAALAWAWRIYAITTGLGGMLASAPITFDALDVSQPGAMGHRHPEGDDFLALAANSGQTSAIGASRLRSPRSVSRSAHTTVAPLVGR